MFKKMQIKMTAYYSISLMLIMMFINIATYLILNSQNEKQLDQETLSIVHGIPASEWLESEIPTKQEYEDSEAYEEKDEERNEGKNDDRDETKNEDRIEDRNEAKTEDRNQLIPKFDLQKDTIKIKTPKTLKSFYFYYIYLNSGELLQYNVPSQQMHDFLLSENKKLDIESQSKLIENKDGTNDIYLSTVKIPIYENGNKIAYVYAGRDVSVAYKTVSRLLLIIVFTSLLGLLIAILIGYFIAQRAIRPIKDAYEVKQRFIADASHELRTPISVISLSSEVLQRELPIEEVFLHQISKDIFEEASRMGKLVENLLLLARADSKKLSINKQSFDINDLISKACASLKYLANEKDITLHNSTSQALELIGDSKLISSVIFILMENAIKYTPAEGTVKLESGFVSLNNKPGIFFSVIDTGIGVATDELESIFHRFYRIDTSRSKKIEGYGLGLSIANEIVAKHGGKIDVKSQIGSGSSFTVTLPKT